MMDIEKFKARLMEKVDEARADGELDAADHELVAAAVEIGAAALADVATIAALLKRIADNGSTIAEAMHDLPAELARAASGGKSRR